MTTQRRSTSAVIFGIMAVMLAPVHVAAYDVGTARPDTSAVRFMLPDLEMGGREIDPFDDILVPRRAIEHPREWSDFIINTAVFVCGIFTQCRLGGAIGYGYYLLTQTTLGMHGRTHHQKNACERRMYNDPMASVDVNDCY